MVNSIPKGYKRTEIGIIPEDWEVKKLGEIGKCLRGVSYNGQTDLLKNDLHKSVRLLRANNIQDGKISLKDLQFVHIRRVLDDQFLRNGDILICMANGSKTLIGKSGLFNINDNHAYTFGAFMGCFRLLDNKKHDNNFVYYLFQTSKYRRYIHILISGSSINNLKPNDIENIDFGIPPISEQRTIARVLSDFDELIESLDKLIEKKKAIKKGAMQELLTGKKRLQGFSGKWVRKKLGEIGEIITGGTPPTKIKKYWNGYIPWITPTDISGKKNIFDSERKITREAQKMVGELPKNTLLVTCIASIGKNAILRKNGACNQQINAIIPNSNFNIDFLYYLLEFNSNRLFKIAGATATPIISKYEFSLFEISLPPTLEEQRAIAQILSDMDEEIDTLEKKKEKYKMLKKGAMELLLTGKVRLKDYNFEKGGNSR